MTGKISKFLFRKLLSQILSVNKSSLPARKATIAHEDREHPREHPSRLDRGEIKRDTLDSVRMKGKYEAQRNERVAARAFSSSSWETLSRRISRLIPSRPVNMRVHFALHMGDTHR